MRIKDLRTKKIKKLLIFTSVPIVNTILFTSRSLVMQCSGGDVSHIQHAHKRDENVLLLQRCKCVCLCDWWWEATPIRMYGILTVIMCQNRGVKVSAKPYKNVFIILHRSTSVLRIYLKTIRITFESSNCIFLFYRFFDTYLRYVKIKTRAYMRMMSTHQ